MPDASEVNMESRLLSERAEDFGELVPASHPRPLGDDDIREALRRPIWAGGAGPVFSRVKPGERVCVVVSDHTRRTATDRVLPLLVEGLAQSGCSPADVFLLVASGIHRHPKPDEVRRILGEVMARRFEGRLFMHDPDDDRNLVAVGATPRGHEVRLNRLAVEADRLILIGTVTYHYHAGFGGGRKSLVPGLAARATIAYNHSLTLDPAADRIDPRVEIGVMDGNPVAEEMAAGARLRPPDFIVNTVLTPSGELVGAFAGDMDAAHRAACRRAEDVSRVDIARRADFVVARADSASNWIQSHKALFNASRAVRPDGRIVLVAPCPDGIGDERFRYWIRQPSADDICRGLRNSPEVLGQTALSTKVRGARTILVTRMAAGDAADLGIETAPTLADAVAMTLARLEPRGGGKPSCYRMPHALHTVPFGVSCCAAAR